MSAAPPATKPPRRALLLALASGGMLAALPGHARDRKGAGASFAGRADVQAFIDDMAARHGFVASELQEVFRRARLQPEIIALMTPPAEAPVRSWARYRANFVNERRIQGGLEFWARHEAALARAASQYGVPAEIIVAIIGIETVYGRNAGNWRVIDALSTLAFNFPSRAEFFRSELEQFLLFAREGGIDLLGVKGSYAGAIGIPQFMPGSWRRWAVDFDGSGGIDLRASPVDAIGSVANFLVGHGWARGEPVAFPASVQGDGWRALAEAGIKPGLRAAALAPAGVSTAAALPPEAPLAFVELATPGAPSEFRIGLQNFWVITRYNRATFYAISTAELAEAIANQRRNQRP